MISCTEFIPAYSELFKELERRGGVAAVEAFWDYLAANFLGNLGDLVEEHGLRGCWMYWSKSLNEESADFTMELDEDKGVFSIVMHHCPSKGRLLTLEHIEPYHDYCRHCGIYATVLEPLGFEVRANLPGPDSATCSFTVTRAT